MKSILMTIMILLFVVSLLISSPFSTPAHATTDPILYEGVEPKTNLMYTNASGSYGTLGLGLGGQPYMAGYMTNDRLEGNPTKFSPEPYAVRVTASFSGTDTQLPPVIADDNRLGIGIAASGPDQSSPFPATVDYGYLMLLVLDGGNRIQEGPHLEGVVYRCYEWLGWFDILYSWSCYWSTSNINSEVTMWMSWNDTHLNYYAQIDGLTFFITSYVALPTQKHYFYMGAQTLSYPIIGSKFIRWFQFPGAWSNYPIGHGGWQTHLKNPSFWPIGYNGWYPCPFAYSIDGTDSYWDWNWRWGGENYPNVQAHYCLEPWNIPQCELNFYYSSSSTLPNNVLFWDIWSGGGGCPYTYAWNGQNFVVDNNLLPASETSGGNDVEDYYRLEQQLTPIYHGSAFSLYPMQIREFEHEHDYFDQTKLLAIDHDSNVNVAVSPYGEILTYQNPDPPISAFDETGASVLSQLHSIDGNYYQGHNGSYITLTFNHTEMLNNAKLVIREDRPPELKCPINIQVLNATGNWNTVATFFTRTYWATDIINMTTYLPDPEGNLKVRLCFISHDKIDYIGLDNTPQACAQIHQATPVTAIHSTQGNVKNLLMNNDQTYAELIPNQQIYLLLLLPNNQNEKRTFILYTEGHYTTMS